MPGACSLASHIALNWAGADFELVILTHEDAQADAFRAINPKGAVPTLVLDDGSVLTESLAILNYIAAAFPSAELGAAPDDIVARAQLDERLSELVSDVHKAWAPIFVPDRYVTQAAYEDDARAAAAQQLEGHYQRLDAAMAGKHWSLFGRRTVADAYLYVMCRWLGRFPELAKRMRNLSAFRIRLEADSDVRRTLDREAAAG